MPVCGDFSYEITRKKVKNMNIRITAAGEVKVTIPMHMSLERAKQFVEDRELWVNDKLMCINDKQILHVNTLVWNEQKRQYLEEIVARIYPRFALYGISYPTVKYRKMKGCYGNCRKHSGIITLNKILADLPLECAEYVVVHELAHLVEANHSRAFYQVIGQIMPDYKLREKRLKNYALCD